MPLGIYNSNAFKNVSGDVQISSLANVEIRRESDSGLASIFSDRAGASAITQVAYPGTTGFKAGTNGDFEFYAEGISGGYQVRVYSDDLTLDKTLRFQATGTAREFDADPFWATVWAAATKLAARIALKAMGLDGLTSRATDTILAAADSGGAFVATGSFTQTLDAAATLGADWHVHYRVNAGQTVTLDPDGAETVDGAATKVVTGPASGYIICDGSAFFTYGFAQPLAIMLGFISGLVVSNNGTDAAHDIDISAGVACASDQSAMLELAAAPTKRIDAAWAVGTNQGGLDGTESTPGTPDADTWYYVHLIRRSDTGVVDALFSESATAPTMPTNYDQSRLIGAVRTDGSANIIAFHPSETSGGGLESLWDAPPLDVDLNNTLTTSRRTDAVSVPPDLSVTAIVNVHTFDASAHINLISSPLQADAAPSATAAPLSNQGGNSANTTTWNATHRIRTSDGTIAARSTLATVDTYRVATVGWEWSRR